MASSGYKTRQKEIVLDYFRKNAAVHTTAAQAVAQLRAEGYKIAPSTVYRCMERLENEGVLRKYVIDEQSAACWQYIEEAGQCRNHFHLKCTCCGELIHADCEYLDALSEHILAHHGFEVDHLKTVLYGTCAACREKQAREAK